MWLLPVVGIVVKILAIMLEETVKVTGDAVVLRAAIKRELVTKTIQVVMLKTHLKEATVPRIIKITIITIEKIATLRKTPITVVICSIATKRGEVATPIMVVDMPHRRSN